MTENEPIPLPLPLLPHPECDDRRCQTCSAAHTALARYIEQRVYEFNTRHTDVLGSYRRWLEQEQGIYCETEHGWADVRYFAEVNVHGFIRWLLTQQHDPDNINDPSMRVAVTL